MACWMKNMCAGHKVFCNYFELDEKSGAEKVYVVWSLAPVPELEKVREKAFLTSDGMLDEEYVRRTQSFLDALSDHLTVTTNVDSTRLEGSGPVLKKIIVLEHL